MDLLGGEIQVESPVHPDPERPGTRFTVSLPLEAETEPKVEGQKVKCPAPAESSESIKSTPSAFSNEALPLILVVEDDEDIRSFITDGLGPDYRIETADNGAAGLQIAKEQVPDLIITDLMMPVMDGITLCRELKTRLETSHIPEQTPTTKTVLRLILIGASRRVPWWVSFR